MSRRARARTNARPWLQQRDAGEADSVEALLSEPDPDEHARDRAWQQHEHEQHQQRSDA